MNLYHYHPVSRPKSSISSGRILDDVMDVTSQITPSGEGEAEAASLRLHQRDF